MAVHCPEGSADLDLPPDVAFHRHPFPGSRRLSGLARLAAPVRALSRLGKFRALCSRIAATMNAEADAALVHNSMYVAAPPLLARLSVPSVYFCYEYPRHIYERSLIRRTGSPLLEALLAPLSAMEKRIDRESTAAAGSVACLSAYMAGRIKAIYGLRAEVIRPGVDSRFFCPSGRGGGGGYALSVGALWPFKGHEFVAAAVAAAGLRDLVIVADRELPGYRRRLRSLCGSLGVRALILGGLTDRELREVYRNAVVVVCGQAMEPYGMVPLEAAACGRPVVAADEGGLPENVLDAETGFVVPRDVSEAGDRIARLAGDPRGADAMGAAGRAFVLARRRREDAAEALYRIICGTAGIEA